VLIVEARRGWTKPVGVVRLFNIHLLEGYAFLETIVTDQRAMRRGFGVEAGKLISYYGVDVLGIRRIEAKVHGDLEGSALLTLEAHDGGTRADVSWRIEMTQRRMRVAARLAGPLLRWGHDRVVAATVMPRFLNAVRA